MEAHAPAVDGGMCFHPPQYGTRPISFTVSADADTLRLERENSSLLDEQVPLIHESR
jgi:hypothetical protein